MEQREIDCIAEQEWERYMEWRKDPKNAKVRDFGDRMDAELNSLGYNVRWGFDMQPSTFNGDVRIFPIIKKYIDEGIDDNELRGCVEGAVWCMAHKKMTCATGYLLEKLRHLVARNAHDVLIDYFAQTIYKIKDKRYIADYLELTKPEVIVRPVGWLILLLGEMKVYEAEDQLIALLDKRYEVNPPWSESFFYEVGYNLSSARRAIIALGKLKSKKAIPSIERFLEPEKLPGFYPEIKERRYKIKQFRELARKTIEKINK